MDINLNIIELLYLHDCIILPGFGGFVTNYINAQISEKNIFSPPCKIVAFNRNLKNDDGLLINYIVKKESVSYVEAKSQINEFVNDINYKLGLSKEFIFEGIGSFKIDKNNILQFEPLASANFLKDSYGLSSFYFPKIKTITNIRKVKRTFKDKESIKPVFKTVHIRKILIGSFLLISFALIPNNRSIIRNLKINLSSFYFSDKIYQSKKVYNNKDVFKNITQKSDKNSISHKKAEIKNDTKPIVFSTNINPKTINEDLKYQIISGCFKNKNNADNYKKTLIEKGLNPSVFKYYNGLYKVLISSFNSEKDAILQINLIHKTFPDVSVWLLKK